MKRRKNLERAVVLGLLLSTSVYGSAWAAINNKISEGTSVSDRTESVSYSDYNIYGTSQQHNYDAGIFINTEGWFGSHHDIDYTVNVNKLYIDIYHDVNPGIFDFGDNNFFLAGVMTKGDNNIAKLTINSNNIVNIKATSQNNYAVAGVWAQSEDTISINSTKGDVVIEANKTSGTNLSYDAKSSDEANKLHAVYGINVSQNPNNAAQNGATVNITANNGSISVSANSTSTDLMGEHIYAVANDNGNINLNAGQASADGDITLIVNANNNNSAYGLDSYYGKQNDITAANNLVVSATSVSGEAYAVKFIGGENNKFTGANNSFTAESTNENTYALFAQEGAVVNITAENTTDNVLDNSFTSNGGTAVQVENSKLTVTGDTLMSGTENGLVVKKDTNTFANGNEEYDVVIKGDLYAQAENGYSSQLMAGTKLLVEGDKVINNTMSIEENAEATVKGNLVTADSDTGESVTVNGNAVEVQNNAELTIGGNVNISATGTGINVTSGNVSVNGANINNISGEKIGINAVKDENGKISTINLTGTTFIEGATGVNAVDGSQFNVTGDTVITASNTGLYLKGATEGAVPANVQSNITGTLFAEVNSTGATAIILENTKSQVGKDEIFNSSDGNGLEVINSDNDVTGSVIGNAAGTGVKINDANSSLTVGGNIMVSGGQLGVLVDGGQLTVNGFGTSMIFGGESGLRLQNGANANFADDTYIVNTIKDSAALDVNGSNFSAKGSSAIIGEGIALNAYKSTVTLGGERAAYNVLRAGEIVDSDVDDSYYGTGLAIIAADDSNVIVQSKQFNDVRGAVYAKGNGASVDFKDVASNNKVRNNIFSNAVIKNAGDLESSTDPNMQKLKVVSALYADNATINLSGINNIFTYYSDPSDETTSERVIWAYNNGDINIDGYTNISTSKYADSPLNKDIAIAAGTATNLGDGSFGENYPAQDEWANVNVIYNDYGELHSSITGDILAAYAGNVDIKAVQGSDAGLDVHGDLLSGNGGTLSVDFSNGGTWTGRGDSYIDAGTADDYKNHQNFYSPAFSSDIITGGDIEVTMNEGTWHVTGQSWINTFNANDTVIYMTDEDNVTNAVTINEMNGTGNTFYMNLDNESRIDSDMLYIKDGGENGATFDVVVTGVINGLSNVTEDDGLRFATVGSGINLEQISLDGYGIIKGVDGGAFNTNLYVKREAYDVNNSHNDEFNGEGFTQHKPGSSTVEDMFGLTQEQEENPEIMMLAAETQENDNTATVNSLADTLSIVRATQDGLSDAGKTMLNMSRANYSNAIYMDRLNKRLGEARYINGEENEGMWVRIRHDRIGKTDAYRSQNTMYELGYDVKQECDNGERRVGFAVDYMHGDTGYSDVAGKGELDRYGLWLYDTWMGDKGHYVDYVAKWGHLDNDFEVYTMSEGKKVTGDYSNNVFSVSAEYGRKKDIGSDWYFEPQAQVQLARVTGADYTTSQGTKVSVDGINSLIGRAGFRIGKDFGEQKQSTVYIKADVLHEFLGDQDVSVMDETTNGRYVGIGYENEGTWYDVGFGFATQTGKNSYAFMDFEKSFGHDNDETYQINAGIQWTF